MSHDSKERDIEERSTMCELLLQRQEHKPFLYWVIVERKAFCKLCFVGKIGHFQCDGKNCCSHFSQSYTKFESLFFIFLHTCVIANYVHIGPLATFISG